MSEGIALKGRKMDFASRMIVGKSGARLEWMMEQGLAWRGIREPGWKFRPRSIKAALYFVFHMLPRGLIR